MRRTTTTTSTKMTMMMTKEEVEEEADEEEAEEPEEEAEEGGFDDEAARVAAMALTCPQLREALEKLGELGEVLGLGTVPGCAGVEIGKWLRPGDEITVSCDVIISMATMKTSAPIATPTNDQRSRKR